jgi:hypothetical protein
VFEGTIENPGAPGNGGTIPKVVKEAYGLSDLMGLSVKTAAVSRSMSKHMRETMHFERQRPISARNVQRLGEEMKAGWFLAGTPIFICVLPNGHRLIVNGNHTLEAIIATGVTVPLTIIEKQVATLEEAARVYAVLDLQKTRTWGDTLRATGFAEDLPLAAHVNAGLGLIMGNFGYAQRDARSAQSRNARLQLLPDYIQSARMVAAVVEGAPASSARVVKRAAVMAVALYTTKFQPSAAEEFWGGMAKDDGLKANDPRKALLRYAANNPSAGHGARMLLCKASMAAWNASFEGRTLEYCKPNSMEGVKILGTPLHRGGAS